jgi:peptidyl-tRNA hydrolase
VKQVIIINGSLKLPKGKLAAQVAHAAVASFVAAPAKNQKAWLDAGMPKIVVSASNEKELLEYYQKAISARVPSQLIKDAGRTVIAAGTITCIGVGPALENKVDKITGQLKLVS